MARTPRGLKRVRFLSAEIARGIPADHIFVLGLGERSFPRLAVAEPIFDEQDRQLLKTAGLDIRGVSDRMPDEMLLFYGIVTRPLRRLVLSYPAVDEKGQELLPSSFLTALIDCFEPNTIPTIRKRMLIEGFDRDAPLSPAEYRVQAATILASESACPRDYRGDLAANLRKRSAPDGRPTPGEQRTQSLRRSAAAPRRRRRVARAASAARRSLARRAAETYIACPFRFLLEDVLHLEPLGGAGRGHRSKRSRFGVPSGPGRSPSSSEATGRNPSDRRRGPIDSRVARSGGGQSLRSLQRAAEALWPN